MLYSALHTQFQRKRIKGRRRLRWIDNIDEDIESIGLTPRGSMNLTKDRGQWLASGMMLLMMMRMMIMMLLMIMVTMIKMMTTTTTTMMMMMMVMMMVMMTMMMTTTTMMMMTMMMMMFRWFMYMYIDTWSYFERYLRVQPFNLQINARLPWKPINVKKYEQVRESSYKTTSIFYMAASLHTYTLCVSIYTHWRILVKILGGQTKILGGHKVVKSDKCMGVSQ